MGRLSQATSPKTADLCFSVAIAALAIVALLAGIKFAPAREPSSA